MNPELHILNELARRQAKRKDLQPPAPETANVDGEALAQLGKLLSAAGVAGTKLSRFDALEAENATLRAQLVALQSVDRVVKLRAHADRVIAEETDAFYAEQRGGNKEAPAPTGPITARYARDGAGQAKSVLIDYPDGQRRLDLRRGRDGKVHSLLEGKRVFGRVVRSPGGTIDHMVIE